MTLSLFSLLMGMSTLGLRHFFMHEQLVHVRQSLTDLIEYTRAQALVRGKALALCTTEDGRHCLNTPQQEWRGRLLVRSVERVLQLKTVLPPSLHLYWVAGIGSSNSLTFDQDGTTGVQHGSFYLCPQKPYSYLAQAVVVLKSGRLRVTSDYSKLSAYCSRD